MTTSSHRPRKLAGAAVAALLVLAGPAWAQTPAPPPKAPPVGSDAQRRSFTVRVSGRGRPIILIPGLSSSGETWKGVVAHLQDRYACHVLTLAGFAGEPPVEPPLLSRVREDLAAYIELLGQDLRPQRISGPPPPLEPQPPAA